MMNAKGFQIAKFSNFTILCSDQKGSSLASCIILDTNSGRKY